MRDSTENKITMAFIRHGETASNRRKSYLGWTDEPLSEDGCEMLLRNQEKLSCSRTYFYESHAKVQTDKRDFI